MRRTYLEISCDECNDTEHYPAGTSDKELRADNWIITRDKKEFCDKECLDEYRAINKKDRQL